MFVDLYLVETASRTLTISVVCNLSASFQRPLCNPIFNISFSENASSFYIQRTPVTQHRLNFALRIVTWLSFFYIGSHPQSMICVLDICYIYIRNIINWDSEI